MNIEKFVIDQQENDEEFVFYLSGELDLSAAPQLRSALETIVNQATKPLILNLKGLKYIDSTGIGIIISVLKIRDELNAPFIVREIPASIKRLFDLTGISEFLKESKENQA
jgi:anti-sigma B factor antagonist